MIKDLSIVILNFNGTEDSIECIESINRNVTDYNFDVLILDNGSINKEKEELQKYCESKNFHVCYLSEFCIRPESSCYLIFSKENLGFARGNNAVVEKIYENYHRILLLNNDTVISKTFIQKMLDFLNRNPGFQFSSCRINNFYSKTSLWNCGGTLSVIGNRKYYTEKFLAEHVEFVPSEFITGCALIVDSLIIKDYGLFTEKFFFGEEDFNFCWRMKQKHIKGACLTECLVYHKISASSKKVGNRNGDITVHFANRIIDMKEFYPPFIWNFWKYGMLFFLNYKLIKWKICNRNRRKIIKSVNQYSKATTITRNDYLAIKNNF